MKTIKSTLAVFVLFMFGHEALSIEQSTAIKVTTILKTENSWDGKPLIYPQGKAEITGMIIEIAPGGETGWHLHPAPSFGMVLQGEIEVRLEDGRTKRIKEGAALAEVMNVLHNGRNPGLVPAKLIVFYAGTVGQKLSVKEGTESSN